MDLLERTARGRAKQFVFHVLLLLEGAFKKYLSILDGNPTVVDSSPAVTAIASATCLLPIARKAACGVTKEMDKVFKHWKERKLAKTISRLAFWYKENKENAKKDLIIAVLKIFISFEEQFMSANCDGGKLCALELIASDIAFRIISFATENSLQGDINSDTIIKCFLDGTSQKKLGGVWKSGRNVFVRNHKWRTCDLFMRVGLCCKENDKMKYYRNNFTETNVYGHRLKFSFESVEDWTEDKVKVDYDYDLDGCDFDKLSLEVYEYVKKEERDIVHFLNEASRDRQAKHEEAMEHRTSLHKHLLEDMDQKYKSLKEHLEIIEQLIRNTF